ncbi:hypothetical protein C2869_19635 [Saccharobesus litoralis]|uniref:Uncharacterized protein n=1 Tax=Saccharobesus litoralis TaxID=2172099 RepID=A0A2S0VW79_9ALTE|nr:carbohydrate porin [Saccharobesus litoralis]AWB68476.1 hypothetical protein C2869_19635 [Saccharobesus litoralis]
MTIKSCFITSLLAGCLLFNNAQTQTLPVAFDIFVDYSVIDNINTQPLRGLAVVSSEWALNQSENIWLSGSLIAYTGDNGSELLGDWQGFDNIDASDQISLYQALIGFKPQENWQILLGQIEANDHFAFTDHGGLFLNSSMGFSPSINGLSSYPDTQLGLVANYQTDNLGISAGVFKIHNQESQRFDQLQQIVQLTLPMNSVTMRLGIWQAPDDTRSLKGAYAVVDWQMARKLSAFVMLANNDKDSINIAHSHLGAGVQYDNVFDSNISLGAGYTQAKLENDKESVVEFFIHLPINQYLKITPDLQWIKLADQSSHKVLTLRSNITF